MKVIVCVDNEYGVMFNNRRQSRDGEVINDIVHNIKDRLWISEFSKEMFVEYFNKYSVEYIELENVFKVSSSFDDKCRDIEIIVDNDMLDKVNEDEWCFVENVLLERYKDSINKVILYNWNKKYPADRYLDINMNEYSLIESNEFKGFSHDIIIKSSYVK